jgi:hypothetical protein
MACACGGVQRGGAFRGPLQYMDTSYSMPAAWTAGVNRAMPEPPTMARPGLAAMGGSRRRSHRRRKHSGGFFAPSIMSPVLSNFGYIAPAIALAGYRYMEQVKSPRGGLSMKSLGLVKRRGSRKTRRRSSKH